MRATDGDVVTAPRRKCCGHVHMVDAGGYCSDCPDVMKPKPGDVLDFGILYRVLSDPVTGPYVRADGKGIVEGIGFVSAEEVK